MSSARLKQETECLHKPSFALLSGFAGRVLHNIIVALEYRDFIKNITDTDAIVEDNHKVVEIQGQTRQHSRDRSSVGSEASP